MSHNAFKSTNSRRHKRLNADYLLKYEPGRGSEELKTTNIKNLSAGGVKFVTRDLLEEQSTVRVNVLVTPIDQSFQANAKVLRVRRLNNRSLYTVAAQFTDISSDDQTTLNSFIEDLATDPDGELSIDHANVVERRGEPIGKP